jgi:hypothetical protein
MGMTKVLRPLTTAVLGGLLSVGCYSATPLRVQVQSRPPAASCVQTTDRVFADAGFERVRTVFGPDMFYTPRTRPGTTLTLGWGIGAWLSHDTADDCSLTIEAISADPTLVQEAPLVVHRGVVCEPAVARDRTFSAQRGETFDAAVRDMARRLEVAFDHPVGPQ